MPMRVIAKKRCRAMVEPPEKGERATLNPNLSTRLKPTFFRSGPLGGVLAIAGRGGGAALSRRPGLDRRPRHSGSLGDGEARCWIRDMKAKIAPPKGAHYFRMLDAPLVECDKTEGRIEAWRRALAQSPRLTAPRPDASKGKA